jgi:hypothetical protein
MNLHRTSAAAAGDPRIRRIELPALQSVGGGFGLVVAEDIPSGTVGDGRNAIGINALTAVGGSIQVTWRIPVYSPSGLSGLTTHASDLHMVLAGDQSHTGFLANLATVQGNVTLDPGHTTVSDVLMGLTHVGGTVTLEDDCNATPGELGPELFDNLTTIDGDLSIHHVTRTVLHGLLPLLTAVGGTMRVEGSGVTNFPLGALPGQTHPMLSLGALSVTDDPQLMSFDASYVRVAASGAITIQNNCILPATTAATFVSDQTAAGWSGIATVSANGTGASCSACLP